MALVVVAQPLKALMCSGDIFPNRIEYQIVIFLVEKQYLVSKTLKQILSKNLQPSS